MSDYFVFIYLSSKNSEAYMQLILYEPNEICHSKSSWTIKIINLLIDLTLKLDVWLFYLNLLKQQ